MNVHDLIADPPKLHEDAGELISGWKLADAELLFLDRHLRAGMKTLETGSGLSTILFALKGTRHTCITPNGGEAARIRAYCEQQGVGHAGITFIAERSEYVLPGLRERDLDLALIDGRHGFPTPFLDWFYIAAMLKREGILMIDDLHIWTAELLKQFLLSEPGWKLVSETGRAAVFAKLDDSAHQKDWDHQPFVFGRSRHGSVWVKARYVASAVRRGDFGIFGRALQMWLRRPRR
jgi:methyltransferase family protein